MYTYTKRFIAQVLLCSGFLQSCHSPYMGGMAQETASSRPTAANYKGRTRACINYVRVPRPALRLDRQWIGGRPSFPSTLLCRCEPSRERPRICTGTSSFAKLLSEGDVFVDKSLFIKEFLESADEVSLITRPRRWGKSLNMDMLKCFLSIEVDDQGKPLPETQSFNRRLFVGGEVELDWGEAKLLKPLTISDYPSVMKRQGQYPVISLSFQDVDGSSYRVIEEGIKDQIVDLYTENYRYLKQYSQAKETLLEDVEKEQ
ncbi:MAG: AAA family ATPase, partial [Bacteroidota bacterium]